MERIQFYPKGESPKNKNYIFFAVYPDDKERYFNTLYNEITAIEANCVFWFDAQADQPWDSSLTELLSEMQLFVFPVTTKLLNTKNNAVSVLLPYALEHRIPVIPILMEPGLEALYECTFGDLQYLDKVTLDITAIPYEEKLKNHLRNILVSKEMTRKIQAAFDAYIFLSYRKKDRALASKLMKLIHEIPQMRDVAIWYDEFLVPGEDFNTNISKALSKSNLFAMAITPNLVNEKNYVLQEEYPRASKTGKPILPLQVEYTDPVDFQREFEELSGCVDAYSYDALERALLNAFHKLQHITLAQNDDPMHTYLIGLAYLNNIDVERDYDRAVTLICNAAENACPEAMSELANMYFKGYIVERDHEKALYWQTEYVRYCKEQYEQSPDDQITQNYIYALAGLGEVYQACLPTSQAESIYLEVIRLLESIPQPTLKQQQQKFNIWEQLGILYHKEGDHSLSCKYFSYCVSGWEDLTAKDPDPQYLRRYVSSLILFANAITDSGNPIDALAVTQEAYTVCNQLKEVSQSDSTLRYYAACCAHLGTLLYRAGQTDQALQLLDAAFSKMRSLAEKSSNSHYYADVAHICLQLAELYESTTKYQTAAHHYGLAVAIFKDNADATGDLTVVQNLCAAYTRQAQALIAGNMPQEAKQCLEDAKYYLQLLSKKGQLSHALSGLSKYNLLMAKLALKEDLSTALTYFQAALEHHLALCRQADTDQLWNELYMLLSDWTDSLLQQGEWRLAKRQCTSNKDLAREMDEKWHLLQSKRLLRDTHRCLQRIYLQQNNASAAVDQLQESIREAEGAAACSMDYFDSLHLTDLYHMLADYQEQKRPDIVAILCQKSIDALEFADPENQVAHVQRYRIQSYSRLAEALQKTDKTAAVNAHNQTVAIAQALAETTSAPDDQCTLAVHLWNCGIIASGVPEKDTAQSAIDLLQELCRAYPGNEEYQTKLETIKQQWNRWKKRSR